MSNIYFALVEGALEGDAPTEAIRELMKSPDITENGLLEAARDEGFVPEEMQALLAAIRGGQIAFYRATDANDEAIWRLHFSSRITDGYVEQTRTLAQWRDDYRAGRHRTSA
jgi:hypothetical protein